MFMAGSAGLEGYPFPARVHRLKKDVSWPAALAPGGPAQVEGSPTGALAYCETFRAQGGNRLVT